MACRARFLVASLLLSSACDQSGSLTPAADAAVTAGPDAAAPDLGPDAAIDPTSVLFAPDHLIEVRIDLAPADWDSLRNQTRSLLEILTHCASGPFLDPFTWFPASVTIDGQKVASVGVRKKGFLGSLDTARPGLKIKFDKYMNGQRFDGFQEITLNNSKQDPSYIHQCLAYRTFSLGGVPTSRCNFAHVIVNGVEHGLYVHVESASQDFLAQHYAQADGDLYEGTLSDFRDGWTNTFDQKSGSGASGADLAPVVAALKADDAHLLAALDPVLDIDKFLTFWATEALINHSDSYSGNTNNFYAYHNPATGKFELMPGPDQTFVRGASAVPGGPTSVMAVSLLARRLYLLPETRDRYIARMKELLAGPVWVEASLNAEIDRMEKLISPVADPGGHNGLAAAINQVRDFVANRRGEIEAELAKGPPVWPAALRGAICFVPGGTVSGSLTTTWGTTGSPDPLSVGTGTLTGTLFGAQLKPSRVGAVAGVDPNANPPFVQLATVGQSQDNSVAVVAFSLAPPLYVPNTMIPIDMGALSGTAYHINPQTMMVDQSGLLAGGTLTLMAAGNAKGAPVTATFTANVLQAQ